MGKYALGQSVPRSEDPRLLRGGGRYADDRRLPGTAVGYVLFLVALAVMVRLDAGLTLTLMALVPALGIVDGVGSPHSY